MQLLLAALWLATATAAPNDPVAPAGEPEPPPDPVVLCRAKPPDRTRPFADELDRAKELYRRGCHAWALDVLRDLDLRRRVEAVDREDAIDARLYLAEVEYVLGARSEARATFEALLVEHPSTTMGLFEHDPDVVDLFNVVKAGITTGPPRPPPLVPVPPRPVWTYLPFGAAHFFENKETSRGLSWFVPQALCGSAALGTYIYHRQRWPVATDDWARAIPWRIANYASNACFLGVYVGSQVDATRRYRALYRARAAVTVLPGGPVITAEGRF